MPLGIFLPSVLITELIFPGIILLAAGNWVWPEGWIFGLWFDVMILFNMVYMYRKDPALLAERMKAPGSDNQKQWDTYPLVAIYAIACLWFVILPLDADRFGWSPAFPVWLKVLGGVALLPALYLIERATIENTYLSTLIRFQNDRKQQVITTGVYGFVRHPLYLWLFGDDAWGAPAARFDLRLDHLLHWLDRHCGQDHRRRKNAGR